MLGVDEHAVVVEQDRVEPGHDACRLPRHRGTIDRGWWGARHADLNEARASAEAESQRHGVMVMADAVRTFLPPSS